MNKSSLRQQQLQLQQQQQQQQMMADNDAAALAAEMFDAFCAATTMRQILGLYRNMCDTIGLRPGPINEFYPKLKQKIRSWKAQALWKKFDTRASHRVYNKGNACPGSRVLVIGAGPCGLRAAIEAQLLGAKVCVVEKRDRISRNNVVHLWPFVITDLRNLGAKKFYGKFCAGSIDHISIRQLQCILLKVALLLGVEIHEGVSFLNTLEPSDGCGWRAEVQPTDHAVSHYEFDVLFGADGKRNTLEGFKRKEFRGKLAIAITANFINKKTEAEARAEEISGVAFIFNQSFFKELYQTTGIDLENIVYYKDETHYFVMTAKKHSLIDKNVIIQDFADPAELLAPQNVNTDKLLDYAREAAEFSTKYQMPNLEFAVNHYGKPDVAMFDFTSMFAAEASSRVIVRKNYRLLQCLVGDSLLEPFWPTGSGCARGFLSSMDAAYMIKLYANQRNSILGTLAQRESIYRLLAQTTPENLQRDIGAYTVDPATRYPNLNKSIVNVWQVKHLIDTDDPNLLEQVHMDTNALQQANIETPIRRKRRTGDMMPLSTVLLRWIKAQLHAHEFAQNLTETSECITNGKILSALINRYRPDLIDLNTIKDLKPIECNELSFKILETDLNIPRCISAKQSMTLENVESNIWLNYLEQICEEFRGEIPHVKHPKLDYFELKEKSSRDKKPDFSHLLNRTTKLKAKSPMQDIDLTTGVHRRSILDEDKVRRQRKNVGSGNDPTVLVAGHGGDTSRRAKKRRSQEKTTNIEERQQRLKEIEANRLERQSKRKQQRYQQTQNFYKSLQMLQAENLLREDNNDQPFEDYSIYMYRQNAPEFNDRVKMLEQKLLHPDRERGIQSAFPRNTDEQFSNRIKSMEQQITSRTASGSDKKPKDLLRAIGKIDSSDWNIREIEKKIEQSKKTETPGKSKEKVPKWSKEQFLARQNKMSKPPVEREEESEEKFKEIDQTLKNLDKQLKEGSIREIGERGKNKVASIAGQFGKKDDTSDEKPATHTKSSSKVPSVFKNQAASEKCHFCKQTVYLMEKISTENLILHRSCLKCYHCHTNLRLGAYAFDRDDPVGRFYCTQHFRLPAKAIRPMARKSTKQQKKTIAVGHPPPSAGGNDTKATDQILRSRPETVAQLDLLDRGQTPERIEFENADAMSDGEPSLENIIDENEWTDRNFVSDSDDSESDLSSSDESDDESESFDDADDGSPIAQTLQLATDWIGKQRYSNGGSDDSDNDFYDSSDGLLDENDADSQTEGEEFKKAREMRRQEVKLLPIPTNLPTDTETEVKQKDDVQLNDNNNSSNQNNNSNNNNKDSNENLAINNSISICSSDNNMNNNIPSMLSKTEIKIIERDLGRAISTEIDTLNENLFNLNNFLKLNKDVENIRKENLVKNDIMKKLSLKEKWLNESNTGASNLSLHKIGDQSEIIDIKEEKPDDKQESEKIDKEIKESEKVKLGEMKVNDDKTESADRQNDGKMDIDTNAKYTAEENNSENTVAKELKTLECEKISTEIEKDNKDEIISNNVLNEVNEIVESIKSITIEKPSKDTKSENANDLSKSIENVNSEPSKAKEKCDDADIGQLLYDVENKCSPKVQRRQKSKALKKIEARSFADTKGVIESQITGPKMSKQSSLDLSRYFPNQKQEKTSTVAANKNQKTLKDVDLNQYFAQSPIAQRKISAPAALRKCSTEKIIPALYKPTIKEKLAEIEPTLSTVVESKPKPNILHYKPTMKEILATDVISADVKSTTSSAAVDSKPKPNILHYKPTMKEILAAPVDSSKIDIESRPIPPKRQKNKVKESGSSENLNKKKTKDSDFNIYDQQVDGSVDLKKKVSKSISKNNEKNPNTTKKKIIKKITKKSPSLSITDDSPKLRKKFDNENSRSAKSPLNYEDEILNEILNSDDYEIRSPSIEYHKLFHEEKSPSEDISDRIEKILIETGIDLGLPRRSSSVNRKKLLKAKSLGEDEFINNKNQLSVFEDNVKEDGDKPISFQNILKRFESMSSVKHSDDKTVENKLNDIHERRYSRDSMKSKKSSSDEFSDLERTLEYLKSEWKTEATNFLQKKRNNFFSKPKSTVELREQIEEDEKRLKRNTEEYFEAQIKYEKSIITKEKSPKRKIMDNGNNKAKEMKIDRTKQEKELVKRRNSKEEKFETNHSEMSKRKNSNENKISVKTISKVKSFEICDSELDDMEVDDIFNEIVNELHINDDKLGTQDIYDVLSNQQVFELQEENKILNLSKNISPVKASKLETDEYKLANKSNENNRELNGLRDDSKICTYKKEVDNDQIKLEKVQNNIAPKQTISPKKSLQNYKYVKPNEEISESNKLHNDSKIHVSHEECTPKNKIEIVENNTLPIKSHSPEDIKLKLVENIKSNEINILQQDVKTSISNKKIETSVTKLEMVNENCMPSKATLSKSNSPKFNNLESQKSAEKYALNNEINNSNSILRKNSLQKATPEISNSPILNSAKAVMEQEKLFFTVSTKSPSSVQKMSSLNCSKSSTDEDSIDQLFSQFTDDMLVDVEFDSNDELIAITPRAIVKKRDELTIENLECFAITSEPIICESAENKTKSNGENLEGIPITYEPIVRKLVEKEQSNVENLGRSEFKSESNIPKSAENKDESKVENLHIRKSVEKKENLECVAHTSEGIIRKSAEEKDESNSEKLEYVPTTSKPVIREFSEKKQSNDDNLECVAYTSEAIIRKSAEKKDELKVENLHIRKSVEKKDDSKVENLECVAHTSEAIIRKSAEKIYESNSEKLEYVPTASKPVIREFAEKNQSNDDNLECVAQTSEGIIRKSAEKKYESNSEKLEYVPTTSKPVIREFAEKNQSNDDNLECVPQTSEGIIRKSAEKKDESNSEKLEYVPTASKPVIREFAEKNQSNDDNLECVAQTSEGIIRKSAEKKYESNSEKLEYVPTTSKPVIRESAEKKQSNDDNLECVAHTSEAIIRKSVEKKDKLNVENLESNATELRSRKSVEEEQNDIQFPMKPPRRQKTVSSSASPDIPSIPIRAKHIAKQSKELPPSVQDIIETMRSNDNDDNNLYFIPINNAKPVRFPSRYEEEEDIAMEYSEPLNANESADCDNIVIADEITASQLVPVIENGRSEFLEYKIVDRVDNFLSSEDNLPVTTLTGDNSTILDKTTPSQIDSEQVEKKLKENICSIQDDHHSKNKSSRDNISIVNNTNEMRSHDKKLVTLPENSCSQDIFDVTKQTNVMTQSNTFVDGDNTSIKLNKTKLDKINVDNFQPIKENVLIQETKKTSPVMKDSNIKETVPEIADSELEDWEIIEKLEKERMRALRKRDQMYFNANNSPSLVDRPRLQTQVSSSDSFESALSKSIPELSVIPKTTTPPPVPPPRSPRPVSKFTHGDKTGQKSLPIEVIEHPLHTVDRAYSPSSTQSKNSSHSLSHSVESISNRPQRPKSNPSENIPVDYGTRMLLERSQMLRDRKKDFMDDKMVGNNPYMKKMITTERKHRADSDNDDEVEFPESYRPSNLNTRNTSYSRFPTSRAIQDRVHYNSAATSSGIDRYGTGTSNQYSRRLSPINTISYSSPINSSRHLTDYFKRSPSSSKEHHYHHHHPRDHQSKDSCVIS